MDNYEGFKQKVLSMTKIDLDAYKEKQMRRRIDSLVSRNSCKSYDEYAEWLQLALTKKQIIYNFASKTKN